ncbi:leucine-rich repeat-containing protein 66 isoform X2 [Sus scrofa]|uniref:Leucine rich repeat containing 66 n=1 Tax=Sus scrofa TaxID=9823 RepID=F1SE78_PIG|nr:leucine-rich repeat-containing protein 66 isoform X2 [Sus scrofa]
MRHPWIHSLEVLNLSNNTIHSVSLDLPSVKSSWVKCHQGSLRNGLPFLKLLILKGNKLGNIPKGLWKLKSLQSLDLSFNGISEIGISDLHSCLQLENLHLKSNKIFRIHPAAFKDLKKLQVVDLSNNALTTILPMMIVALELPHLQANLADNQWQCDNSVAVFQNFISESWREKWNTICNKSTGKEEAYQWAPKSRTSGETRIPRINLNHTKSLRRSNAESPGEAGLSSLGKTDPARPEAGEQQRRLHRRVRSTQDGQTAGRKEAASASQDLTLAVCLAVFITFLVAFCLGAFARPYVDRLWQQRCQKKSPGSGVVYSNQGFYDEIDTVGNTQQPRTDQHQTFQDVNLYENQAPGWRTEASPRTDVALKGTLRQSRKEPGSQQGRGQCRDPSGSGSRRDEKLPNHSVVWPDLRAQPDAEDTQVPWAGQDRLHRDDIPTEGNYDPRAGEVSPNERSVGIAAEAVGLQNGPGSIQKDFNESGPPVPRKMMAPLSEMPTHTEAPRPGENEGRWASGHLPSGFFKENLLSAQQQRLKGSGTEAELPAHHTAATLSDPGHMDPSPPALPPGWGRDPHVTPANKEPEQKHASEAWYELDSNSDSDEGSLFTLSSSSEDWRHMAEEEEAPGEESGTAPGPLEDKGSGERRDNVMSLESLGHKCETQEDRSEKTLISNPVSGLFETHLESASNISKFEDPLSSPGSVGHSPCSHEIPGMSIYDYISALQPQPVEWHCSLRDLEFSNVDILPPTPACSAEVPSDPEDRAVHEGDVDIYN